MKELTEAEKRILAAYQLEKEPALEVELREEEQADRKIRRARLFYSWIAFLAITPIVISSIFLIIINRLATITDNQAYREILDNYKGEELEKATGLDSEKVSFFTQLSNNASLVILGIFSFFIALIAFSYLLRSLQAYFRNKHGQ